MADEEAPVTTKPEAPVEAPVAEAEAPKKAPKKPKDAPVAEGPVAVSVDIGSMTVGIVTY